ncbi:MAG: hypothetical protein R2789_11085 [Microthrixaceae bacterium]
MTRPTHSGIVVGAHVLGGTHMYRKHLVAASTLAVVALLAACTLPAPAERNWKVSPTSVKVIDQEDFDPGDEPYVIQRDSAPSSAWRTPPRRSWSRSAAPVHCRPTIPALPERP